MNKMKTETLEGTEVETPEDVATTHETTVVRTKRRSVPRVLLMAIVPLLLLLGGAYYYFSGVGSVSTDNASVKQDIVSVSAQVNGPVVEVLVKNGDHVKRGQLLFRIDPAPFRVALEQARAQLAAARLQTTQLQTQAAGTGADITGAQANLRIKQNAFSRQAALLNRGFTTRADYEDAMNEVRAAETALADARARRERSCRARSGRAALDRAGPGGR